MPGAQSPRRRADSASSQTSSLESFSCASSSASAPFGTASSDSEQLCLNVVTSSQLAEAVTLSEAAFNDVPATLTSPSAASAVNLDTLTVPSTADTPASLVPVPPHESATPVAASSPAVSPTTALSAVQTPTTPTAAAIPASPAAAVTASEDAPDTTPQLVTTSESLIDSLAVAASAVVPAPSSAPEVAVAVPALPTASADVQFTPNAPTAVPEPVAVTAAVAPEDPVPDSATDTMLHASTTTAVFKVSENSSSPVPVPAPASTLAHISTPTHSDHVSAPTHYSVDAPTHSSQVSSPGHVAPPTPVPTHSANTPVSTPIRVSAQLMTAQQKKPNLQASSGNT